MEKSTVSPKSNVFHYKAGKTVFVPTFSKHDDDIRYRNRKNENKNKVKLVTHS